MIQRNVNELVSDTLLRKDACYSKKRPTIMCLADQQNKNLEHVGTATLLSFRGRSVLSLGDTLIV